MCSVRTAPADEMADNGGSAVLSATQRRDLEGSGTPATRIIRPATVWSGDVSHQSSMESLRPFPCGFDVAFGGAMILFWLVALAIRSIGRRMQRSKTLPLGASQLENSMVSQNKQVERQREWSARG